MRDLPAVRIHSRSEDRPSSAVRNAAKSTLAWERYRFCCPIPIAGSPSGACSSRSSERQAQNQFAGIEAQLQFGELFLLREAGRRDVGSARQQIADIRAVLAPLLPLGARQLEKGVTVESDARADPLPLSRLGMGRRQAPRKRVSDEMGREGIERCPARANVVLGAGASRLAYDLHLRCGASETVALDLDPLLLTVAHHVIRGEKVSMTEASISVHEMRAHRGAGSSPRPRLSTTPSFISSLPTGYSHRSSPRHSIPW